MLQQKKSYYEDYGDTEGYEEDPRNTEMETLYVYSYDPEKLHWNKDRIIAAIMGLLTLAMIIALCFIPNAATYETKTIRVPAQFHALQFKADSAIIPTGKKVYPAIEATGTLTIYNGSIFTQQLPAGFIVTSSDGVEVTTDYAVTIPAADLPSLGVTTVSAHALIAGSNGNIQANAIQSTYGSAIKIKNLAAFSGGQNAYTVTYATNQDKQNALDTARQQVTASQPIGLLAQPCTDAIKQTEKSVSVTRACTFVTYQAPNTEVLSVHLAGHNVILTVRVLAHVVTTHFVK